MKKYVSGGVLPAGIMLLAGLVIGGGLIALGWSFYSSARQLRDEGVSVSATLCRKWSEVRRRTAKVGDLSSVDHFFFQVRFLPEKATAPVEIKLHVTDQEYAAAATGSSVMIRYLPDNPEVVDTERSAQNSAASWAIPILFCFFGCVALLLFGIGALAFYSTQPADQAVARPTND